MRDSTNFAPIGKEFLSVDKLGSKSCKKTVSKPFEKMWIVVMANPRKHEYRASDKSPQVLLRICVF